MKALSSFLVYLHFRWAYLYYMKEEEDNEATALSGNTKRA